MTAALATLSLDLSDRLVWATTEAGERVRVRIAEPIRVTLAIGTGGGMECRTKRNRSEFASGAGVGEWSSDRVAEKASAVLRRARPARMQNT